MPTEVPNDVEFQVELPKPPGVPLRAGEDGFENLLNMEDNRRKDSIIAELQQMIAKQQGTSVENVRKVAMGKAARKRVMGQRQLLERLNKATFRRGSRWEGPCVPATIVNLNPVALRLDGEMQRWTVPAAGKGKEINLNFRGRTFVGSYMTVTTPHLYMVAGGVASDPQAGDMPEMQWSYIPPLGIVHQFFEHYVEGASDAQHMGGVIIFEGDIHNLSKPSLDVSQGHIWVPKKDLTLEGLGDVVYTPEPVLLKEVIELAVVAQRNFADMKISEGHNYATHSNEIIRSMLSNEHRLWHNYALEKGYIEKALPWATERMRDTPTTQVVLCPDCRTRQTSPDQFICPECNSPFDALKAFLAGKPVSKDKLAMYEGEEWELILKEMKRRNAKIAMLEEPFRLTPPPEPEPEPPAPRAQRSPAKTKAEKEAEKALADAEAAAAKLEGSAPGDAAGDADPAGGTEK